MANSGILGSLFDGLRDAIADVRHKVVEEGWFGKRTDEYKTAIDYVPEEFFIKEGDPRYVFHLPEEPPVRLSFDEFRDAYTKGIAPAPVEPDEHDRGIDL